MCWIGKATDIRVSKEDVKVFKVLYTKPKGWGDLDKNFKRSYLPPYYPLHYYYLDTLYESEIVVKDTTIRKIGAFGIKSIHTAIHCYSSSCKWKIISENLLVIKEAWRPATNNITELSPICHYLLEKTEPDNLVLTVVEGIIPAGTEYWQNDSGEIATSKLILKKVRYMYDEKRK